MRKGLVRGALRFPSAQKGGSMKRIKESMFFWVILVFLVSMGIVATGCSKKQVVKEEAAGKPLVAEKKEPMKTAEQPQVTPAPVAPPEPKTQAKVEPKKETPAIAEEKPAPFDLSGKRIHFAFDDYSISVKARERLDEIASWMKKTPGVKIQIQGNTCDIGTDDYNLSLGDQRARSAKKYLEALGLESARLSTISYGEERPMVPNSDEKNRSLNRRDDFVLVK
jgi:peptidoglycan-associated lipoprotein